LKKVDHYVPEIKNGFPPPREKSTYNRKIFDGELLRLAEVIKPGQYVESLSAGSMGKFARLVESRGLEVIRRRRQGESRGTIYVVTPRWLAEHREL
jgi:hypothetical protein